MVAVAVCAAVQGEETGFQMCQLLLPLTFALLTSNYCFNFPHIRSWRTGDLSFFTCKMGHWLLRHLEGVASSPSSDPRLLFSTRKGFSLRFVYGFVTQPLLSLPPHPDPKQAPCLLALLSWKHLAESLQFLLLMEFIQPLLLGTQASPFYCLRFCC